MYFYTLLLWLCNLMPMISVKTQNKHNSSDYTPIVTCLDRQQIDTTYIHNIWLNETCRDNMFYTTIFVGPVAQWKRIRLRIWGLQVRSLPGSSFYTILTWLTQHNKQRNKEKMKKKTENPNCTHNYLFNTHTKNLFIFTYPLPYMLLCAQHHNLNNYIRLYKNTIMPLDNQIQKCSRQVSNLRPWRY